METILREITYQNWITILLVTSLVFLAVAKFLYAQRFEDFITITGADRFIVTRSRGVYIFHPLQLILATIQCIGISLLLYVAFCITTEKLIRDNYAVFLVILAGYSTFEIAKFLTERLSTYAFDIHKKMQPFIYKRLNVKNMLGLFALISSAFIVYQLEPPHILIYSIIILIIVIYTISQFLLLRQYREQIFKHPFYFILYFCTLEIGPYFILYEFITM